MEVYKGTRAKTLAKLSRQERENIMLNILKDPRLDFEEKVNTAPSKRRQTETQLINTRALHPNEHINRIAVEWVCMGTSQRYVLIAQLALMNSQSFEDSYENQ